MSTSASQHPNNFNEVAKNTGLVLMALAATIGMVELPEHPNSKIIINAQPVFAFATENIAENTASESKSSQRREREEAGPHYVSYSAAQRTPGRTGRI